MIILKEIELLNVYELQKNIYKNKNISELEADILTWKDKKLNGKYFEMLGVFNKNEFVGILSLAEQTKNSVSLGIEIFEKSRRLGFGFEALKCGLEKAKQNGYSITVNQVRTDNFASRALCEKCKFETNYYEYINKKGSLVYLYIKQL